MAITKRMTVSFDLKLVIDSEVERAVMQKLRKLAYRARTGDKLNGLELAILNESLTNGPESAVELTLKKHASEILKATAIDEMGYDAFSNFRMVFKR